MFGPADHNRSGASRYFSSQSDGFKSTELDALGQRQVVAPVDGRGLSAHVGLPRVRAGLATATGLLLAAERPADLGARGADVDVGDPTVRPGGAEEALGVLQRLGEYRRRQALRHVVLDLDGLLQRVELDDPQDRGERLVLGDRG